MTPRIPPPSAALPGGDWSAEPAAPLGSSTRSPSPASPKTPDSPTLDKGKCRADAAPGSPLRPPSATASLTSLLDEALHSPLDLRSSPPKGISSPPPFLARPPPAHRPSGYAAPGLRPRLMTKLSSTTSPTAKLTFASADEYKPRERERYVSSPEERSEHQWEWRPPPSGPAHFHKHMLMERHGSTSAFPELDPATGLPLSQPRSEEIVDESRDRHLQRTISEQWRRGSMDQASGSKPLFGGLPAIPSMPVLPTFQDLRTSVDGQRRSISTSTSAWTSRMFSTSKNRIDSMLSEEDQAPTKEEETVKHKIKYQTPKNPIVLCHGLLGFDFIGPANLPVLQISHWRGIREVLEKSGCEVLICRVPATGSIMERAEVLHQTIAEKFPGRKVNLIAHSMVSTVL